MGSDDSLHASQVNLTYDCTAITESESFMTGCVMSPLSIWKNCDLLVVSYFARKTHSRYFSLCQII